MHNETMYNLGSAPSAIRELFAYGMERKAQIGDDNVFDFSIGNPSVPAPDSVAQAIRDLADVPPAELHAYSAAQGLESTRAAIAENLNKRFGTSYTADNFYLTMGAAACLSACFTALVNPGDEVIVISPYFPEYRVWIEFAGGVCVEVPAREDNFQIDLDALKAAITTKTKAVVINTPNNPVGTVYTRETLEGLAAVLKDAEKTFGHPIYLISDEPYRELTYGVEVPWVPAIYNNTLVCYSWSKSLSLPGDRIGYVLVPDEVDDARAVYLAVCGAGRSLGYICAPVFFQRIIERVVDEPTNVEAYAVNRQILTSALDELGYEYIAPDGAFYLWIKALEPDAQAFSNKAKEHELLLVPSDSFGVGGWVRAGYCIAQDTIERSIPAFAALKKDYE
ncbi:pyridoxal phosphate-dependent aminotransferase [Anaerotardibacter muris]|uniref:pyridoxal phosphate-dependent aminotransferase n=1 Tax=Anaerotardibacter muris TaxID=2941505 RepID=UPI002040900D|nr:pyridoxal phosphate-dependent aminotransferase [Anaerotardibacter muris]